MNSNDVATVTVEPGYRSVIERAATDPTFDVDKLERLMQLHEAAELRAADAQFNVALADAQTEMKTISMDAWNPQTRSRYATYGQLLKAVQPIYSGHGFGCNFNTEPTGSPDSVRVLGYLQRGVVTRRFQVDVPVETTGPKGTAMMTRIHATMSAISYGQRKLLGLMFNLATTREEDDDGNGAGSTRPPPRPASPTQFQAPRGTSSEAAQRDHDPLTGEAYPATRFTNEVVWEAWCARLLERLRSCKVPGEIDGVLVTNSLKLTHMKEVQPEQYKTLQDDIATVRSALVAQQAAEGEQSHE